jgi:hypothetical protein
MTDAVRPRRINGNDVLAIIDHIDSKVDGLEKRLMTVIREGREAHTKEHSEQQSVCQTSMEPLQTWYSRERRRESDRSARSRPLVRSAVWVTDHWPVSLFVGSIIAAVLYHFGVLQP